MNSIVLDEVNNEASSRAHTLYAHACTHIFAYKQMLCNLVHKVCMLSLRKQVASLELFERLLTFLIL